MYKIYKQQASNILFFSFRIFFAITFMLAAFPKLKSPYEFSSLVTQYQILPISFVHLFSAWLPALEMIIAFGFIFTPFFKEFSRISLLLIIMFIIALSQALFRDLGVTCGCFSIEGSQNKIETWIALIRDIIFITPLLWMSLKAKNKWLWKSFAL